MVPAMDGNGDGVGLLRRGEAEGDRQHDGVAVRHHRSLHRLFGIMAIGHVDVIGQRRSGQMPANAGDVDDLVWNAKPVGTGRGEVEFLAMALAVIEGKNADEFVLGRDITVRERNGVQSAGADDDSSHNNGSLVLTGVGCDRMRAASKPLLRF